MSDFFKFPKARLFVVRTAADGEDEPDSETVVWAFDCSAHEIQAHNGPLTLINADHVRIAVAGRFVEVVQVEKDAVG